MSGERSDHETDFETQGRLRLPSLGRMLGEPLADLVAAAAFLRRVLPEIATDLRAIRRHVASMDPEMVGMHASVERIEDDFGMLNDKIGELADRMGAVEAAVARLEPHVADVNLAVRPWRRARAHLPMRPPHERSEGAHGDSEGAHVDERPEGAHEDDGGL